MSEAEEDAEAAKRAAEALFEAGRRLCRGGRGEAGETEERRGRGSSCSAASSITPDW